MLDFSVKLTLEGEALTEAELRPCQQEGVR